jgi:hypothetical protein
MEDDEPVTRAEINRLWADLAVLQKLIAEDVGHRWGADRIRRWHENAVAAHEIAMAADPAIMTNTVRALDRLAGKLLRGAKPPGS